MTDWWWLAILFGLVSLNLWLLHRRVRKLEKRAHLDDVRRMAEALAEADAEGMREYVPAHDDEIRVAARKRSVGGSREDPTITHEFQTEVITGNPLEVWARGDELHYPPCKLATSAGKEACDCWHSKVGNSLSGAIDADDLAALKRMTARARDEDE